MWVQLLPVYQAMPSALQGCRLEAALALSTEPAVLPTRTIFIYQIDIKSWAQVGFPLCTTRYRNQVDKDAWDDLTVLASV